MHPETFAALLRAFGWSNVEAGRRFHVTAKTISSWTREGVPDGPAAVLAGCLLVGSLDPILRPSPLPGSRPPA